MTKAPKGEPVRFQAPSRPWKRRAEDQRLFTLSCGHSGGMYGLDAFCTPELRDMACASGSGPSQPTWACSQPLPSCRSLPLASMSQTGDESELVAWCGVVFTSELVPREMKGCERHGSLVSRESDNNSM
ncbi:hypothetical protein ACHAQJ_004117 [Trichoderma viride]